MTDPQSHPHSPGDSGPQPGGLPPYYPPPPSQPGGYSDGYYGQPGYGQPPGPGGYGQPAGPGFGQPAGPGYGSPAGPGYGQPAGPGFDPAAPFGRHPITGEPYSDKSKTIAGLLQLLGLFGFVGIGRIYVGQTGLGIAQLIVGFVTCFIGAVIWGLIDAVLIFTDKVRDAHGRPLRDGT